MIVVETLLPALAGLLFLSFCGWALTGWLLPAGLGGLRWTALPWTGYAAFVVLAQFATQAGLNMAQTAGLAGALALLLNAVYLWRRRAEARWPWTDGRLAGWSLAGLTAGVFVLGILPLLFYGYSTIIGENWDGEIYLALGAYLQDYAQPALGQAPANPLLTTLLVPPYGVRTHGFSYAQAAVGALTGLPSLATLSPLLALLRALALPATYFFFRTAWGWAPRSALLATAALGLNPFLLWITYNTFGMQVPSLGLLPLSVAATLLALRAAGRKDSLAPFPHGEGGETPPSSPRGGAGGEVWRFIAYAALTTAALAVTYHPALTAWVALAGAGGLAVLVQSGRRRLRVIGAGIGVGVGALALSAVAQWLSLGGFLAQYADQTPGLGLTAFTAPTDALGLSLSFRALLASGPGQPILARVVQGYGVLILAGGLVCVGLAALWVAGLLRRRAAIDWLALATLAGGLAYLLVFWRPLDYVYGWFKAQSFVAFVLVGGVVGGGLWLIEHGRRMRVGRVPLALLPVALPVVAGAATLSLLLWQYHWPLRYSAEMVGAAQVRNFVQPGDTALVSNSRLMPGRLFNGLLAYFLQDSRLYGTFSTANSKWNTVQPTGVYTWAVLPEREPPQPYGYRPTDRVWANGLLALYQAPADLLYTQSWDRKGDFPQGVAALLPWQVLPSQVHFGEGPVPAAPPVSRTVEFGVAAFVTQTLGIDITSHGNTLRQTVSLAPGLQQVSLDLEAPASLHLIPREPGDPAAVRWVTLRDRPGPAASTPGVSVPITDVLMLNIASRQQGSGVQTTVQRVDTHPPDKQADRVVLDIYRAGGAGGEADHFGYWSYALTAPTSTLQLSLADGVASAGPGAAPLPADSRRGAATSGHFSAALTFYRGAQPLDTVTDIYTFDARPNAEGTLDISNVAIRAFPLLFY